MGDTPRSVAPAVVAGVTITCALVTMAVGVTSVPWSHMLAAYSLAAALDGLVWGIVGALVLRERPGNVLGPLFAFIGIWASVGAMCGALSAVAPTGSVARAWLVLGDGVWITPVLGLFIVPMLYPDGHLMSRRWRIPLIVSAVAATLTTVAFAVSVHAVDSAPDVANPIALRVPDPILLTVALAGIAVVLIQGLVALGAQVLRMRRTPGRERARLVYLVAAMMLLLVALAGLPPGVALVLQVVAAAFIAIGIVRYQMFDIERVFTRGLVLVIVIGAALAAALATATVLGSRSEVGIEPVLVATLTAVLLAGAFSRISTWVNRLLFGRRGDPASAVTLLGERLADAVQPEDVLPVVVTTLRESLRAPYAAVVLEGEQAPAAESGERTDRTTAFPLQYAGRPVGVLELGIRRGERDLAAQDRRLVMTFAAQAGAAAHSAQVARALRRSREGLVLAREEERRLLRRELHDGVGPALAGISLGLQSLTRSITDDRQRQLSADLLEQAQRSLEELRTVARELRPAALDELGLVVAVRQHAALASRLTGDQPRVWVEAPDELPELNAAVEVAAFRIVQEGLSNAIQHADASRCDVALAVDESLIVTVRDDGSGRRPREAGAGLRSMRERAEELGGHCTVSFEPGSGTSVRAVLPLMVTGTAAVPA